MCDKTDIHYISESAKCNLSCGTSLSNGECGGIGYFSMYESMNVSLPDAHFGGFCLTCRQQSNSNKTLLYSIDCTDKATGFCVKSNGEVLSLPPIMSTIVLYWRHCKNNNTYIVGDTSQTFCDRVSNTRSCLIDCTVWTGIRKYKIDNSNIDNNSCYIIEIQNETVSYNKRNRAPFFSL